MGSNGRVWRLWIEVRALGKLAETAMFTGVTIEDFLIDLELLLRE